MKPNEILSDESHILITESGLPARKGTIYATIKNAYLFDQLIQEIEVIENRKEIEQIIQDIKEVIPALEAVKLFDFFSIEEWLALRAGKEGRALVGLLYLQQFPEKGTLALLETLQSFPCSPLLKNEIEKTKHKLRN